MKRIITMLLFAASTIYGYSQFTMDSVKDYFSVHDGRLNALDERVANDESELFKVTKIKISGYIQGQWDLYQTDARAKSSDPFSTFYLRRVRVKFQYQAVDGVRFVLQPDFSTGKLELKDAYAIAYLPKFTDLKLWAGQFNRPNYEVEYSSSQREVLERSKVIRNIYPGEREVGIKLEYTPSQIPLKVQFAVVNGNFTGTQAKDVDSRKDLMGRITYSLNIPGPGIGIDFGVNGYYGGLKAQSKFVSNFEAQMDSVDSNLGTYLDKQWFGGEAQIYFDLLGGLALKGEFVQGKNAYPGSDLTSSNPYKERYFMGYYAYLIKNIGKSFQVAARYDYFDPNTKLSGDAAGKEVYYQTLNMALQYYMNENIRISLNYEMPYNEKNTAYPEDRKDNTFGIRVQAKF